MPIHNVTTDILTTELLWRVQSKADYYSILG